VCYLPQAVVATTGYNTCLLYIEIPKEKAELLAGWLAGFKESIA
jgi:hypothetical protein